MDLKQILSHACHFNHTSVCEMHLKYEFNWTETIRTQELFILAAPIFFPPLHLRKLRPDHLFYSKGGPPGVLTWYCASWLRRLSSLNSSWMLVTSASVLSVVHRGGWAVPFPMLTSENGIFEGVLKAGINRDPRSFFKWTEQTWLWRKMTFSCLFHSDWLPFLNSHTTEENRVAGCAVMGWLTAFSRKSWSPVRW